ncbi:hypothetical protein D9M70_370100 [compost metagenome]
MRSIRLEFIEKSTPRSRIVCANFRYAVRRFVKAGGNAEIRAVPENTGKATIDWNQIQAMRDQLFFEVREERRASEHRQIHRAKVVPEPW